MVLEIERAWGKYPGWFQGLDDGAQWDLIGAYLIQIDPSARILGGHPSILSMALTPAALLHSARLLMGKADGDNEPQTVDDFAKQMGWV